MDYPITVIKFQTVDLRLIRRINYCDTHEKRINFV